MRDEDHDRAVRRSVTGGVTRRSRWPLAVVAIAAIGLWTVIALRPDGTPAESEATEDPVPFDAATALTIVDGGWVWTELDLPPDTARVGLIDGVPWALVTYGGQPPWYPTRDPGELFVQRGSDWEPVGLPAGEGWFMPFDDVLFWAGPDPKFSTDRGATWSAIEPGRPQSGRYVTREVQASAATILSGGRVAMVVGVRELFDAGSYLADHHPDVDLDDALDIQAFGQTVMIWSGDRVDLTEITIDEMVLDEPSIAALEPGRDPETRVIEIDADGTVLDDRPLDVPGWPINLREDDDGLVVEAEPSAWRRTDMGWVEEEPTFWHRKVGGLEFSVPGQARVRQPGGSWSRWDGVVGFASAFADGAAIIATRTDADPPRIEIVGDTHTLSRLAYDDWTLERNDGTGTTEQWYIDPPLTEVADGVWQIDDATGATFQFTDDEWTAAIHIARAGRASPNLLVTTTGTDWARQPTASALGVGYGDIHPTINGGVAMVVLSDPWGTVRDAIDRVERPRAWIATTPS